MEKCLQQFLIVNAPLSGFITSVSLNIDLNEKNLLQTSSAIENTLVNQSTTIKTAPSITQSVTHNRNFVLPLQTVKKKQIF